MSLTITAFEVPQHIACTVVRSPGSNRGVHIVTTTTPDVVGLHLYPLPHGFRYLAIHRQVGAPRLLAKLGVLVHGGRLDPFDMRCCLEPSPGQRATAKLYGDKDWLRVVEATYNGLPVGRFLLDTDRIRALWAWLSEWIETGDQRHRSARRGLYGSIEQEREERAQDRAWEREIHEVRDAADDLT